mgnify:CR=1 FL=1
MLYMKFENLWVSATECRALMGSVRAIEQGLLELKRGRPGPSPLAQDAGCDGAIAAIEREQIVIRGSISGIQMDGGR